MGKQVTAVGSWGTRNFIAERFDVTVGNLILNYVNIIRHLHKLISNEFSS